MTTSVSRHSGPYTNAAPELLDSLFYGISHDLRSPLLTVSISAQLLEHALKDLEADGATEALGGLRAACDDLERMLAALNALSRASRRASEAVDVNLEALCASAPAAIIALDETTADELATSIPHEAQASIEAGAANISWPMDELDGSPLRALAGSLQTHAGSSVEALACLEIALERHGGTLEVAAGRVEVRLPVVAADAS